MCRLGISIIVVLLASGCGGPSATSGSAASAPTSTEQLPTSFTDAQKAVIRAHVQRVKMATYQVATAWRGCPQAPAGKTCVDLGYHRSKLHQTITGLRAELEKAQSTVSGACHSSIAALQTLLTEMDHLMFKFHNDVQNLDRQAIAGDNLHEHRWARRWNRASPRFEHACG